MDTNTSTLDRTNEVMYAVAWIGDEPSRREPEGWREFAVKMWPEGPREGEYWPNGYKPFFWPTTKRLYTTRKAAEGRRDLINKWGGHTVVVVAEVNWVLLEEMDAKWKRERLEKQRQAIEAELAELA